MGDYLQTEWLVRSISKYHPQGMGEEIMRVAGEWVNLMQRSTLLYLRFRLLMTASVFVLFFGLTAPKKTKISIDKATPRMQWIKTCMMGMRKNGELH